VAAGDINGDGLADIICGAGPGGGPNITVFSGLDGSLLGSFFAFPSTFTGGVNVAAASITDSSTTDIIAGAGPGGGPEVSIFQGADFQPVQSYFAYGSTFRGGVRVSAGDPGGQTYITTTPGSGGGPEVNEFSVAVSDSTTQGQPLTIASVNQFYAYASSFRGGVNVAGDGSAKGGDHVDYGFIHNNEGTSYSFYVPTDDDGNPVAKSGITVANGVDLSTDMQNVVNNLPASSPVYQQFLNIKNSGLYTLTGAAAQAALDDPDNTDLFQPLPDAKTLRAVNSAVYLAYYNETMTRFNTNVASAGGSLVWNQLPAEFQTVLLDIDIYGGIGSLTGTIKATNPLAEHVNPIMSQFWYYVVHNDWQDALKQLQSIGYLKTGSSGDVARVTKEVNELSSGIARIGASIAVPTWVIFSIPPTGSTPTTPGSSGSPSTTPVTTFDGAYSGSYSGTGTDDGYTAPASGGVSLTISNGVITVSAPGGGSGTVAANGVTTFSGAGGSGNFAGADYTFSGTFVVAPNGTASGSGGWDATLSGGSASGTWSVARI
jgi:hypothetical protein